MSGCIAGFAGLLVNHRVPFDPEDVRVALADEILRHGDRFAADDGFDRAAGGDITEQRQLDCAAAKAGGDELDGSAAVPGALDEPFFLQIGQVLVDGGERREPKAPADFLQAWGIAVLLNEIVEVIEDFPLTLRQWQHARILRKGKAKVNGAFGVTFAIRASLKRETRC